MNKEVDGQHSLTVFSFLFSSFVFCFYFLSLKGVRLEPDPLQRQNPHQIHPTRTKPTSLSSAIPTNSPIYWLREIDKRLVKGSKRMDHCTNCGKKLEGNREFCTGCSQKVQQAKEVTPSRVKRRGAFIKPVIVIALFVVIGLLVGGVFYIVKHGTQKPQNPTSVSHESALKKDERSSSDDISEAYQNKAKENPKEKSQETSEAKPETIQESTPEKNAPNANVKTLDIDSAIEELNNLSIHANGRDISLGEWDITKNDGKLIIQADAIPPANLEHIFTLYDQQNLAPIKKWSVEVLHIAQELEKQLQLDWSISVGNDCVAQYPQTLPSVVITQYSGSCGYSIPVLEASNWGI